MKIVIDTNRIIAALIKDGYSRAILSNKFHEFIAPEFAIEEIYKYKEEILCKSEMDELEFDNLFSILFKRISIIERAEYSNFVSEAEKIISDKKDAPFIALYLSIKANGIWSDDKHFLAQKEIKIFTTKDLADFQDI
ncbi:MAG: PIN domain-containing protein [Nanoarchaeota archaeon]